MYIFSFQQWYVEICKVRGAFLLQGTQKDMMHSLNK